MRHPGTCCVGDMSRTADWIARRRFIRLTSGVGELTHASSRDLLHGRHGQDG
jgi:hypothetical protein